MKSRKMVETILGEAGITINGQNPFDIQVNDDRTYDRVLADGVLGLGESYMDGWWDCEALDEMIFKCLRANADKSLPKNIRNAMQVLRAKLLNLQSKAGSRKVAEQHYDLGNDLYNAFLDPYMQYSCAYFKDTDNLDKAEEQKLDLICRKLDLKSTDHVLDIGCGWGGLAKWMAEKYGCRVTGVTISKEQAALAREFTDGLPVTILEKDYRDITETYDKVVSVGMFEHVGYKNYRKMMEVVKKVLKPEGLFLLHTIGRNDSTAVTDAWIEKYIFPNSMLPSPSQISNASENLFILEDWHSFGPYYDKTLLAWWHNFDKVWPQFAEKYGGKFYRMFRYYLLSCAGAFRARDINLWQIVFSPQGIVGGYESVR